MRDPAAPMRGDSSEEVAAVATGPRSVLIAALYWRQPYAPPARPRTDMTSSLSDLRLAIRGLCRSPLFATVAILSLALGIGANTAIFTLIDQILLRKLPVVAPDQLVMLYQQGANMGSNMGMRMHSYPLYQDLQKKAEPLAEVLCRRMVSASLSMDNQTERVEAELVS